MLLTAMETKPPVPLAILVGIQTPGGRRRRAPASLEELGRLVKTLGYEVAGTVSQRREGTGAGSLLGSGKLAELAALTGRHRRGRLDGAALRNPRRGSGSRARRDDAQAEPDGRRPAGPSS
jgi:GTP-binding protein HflX